MGRFNIFKNEDRVVDFCLSDGPVGFSYRDQKDEQAVKKNRQINFDLLNIDLSHSVFCQQVHGDNVHVVVANDAGRGSSSYESGIPETDALITNLPNICLALLVADCVPIFFYDRSKKVIGMAHAGWRGTMLNIAGKTVQKMVSEFGTDPKNILVGIGPSIGPNCFEVGDEVATAAKENMLEKFLNYKNDKIYFDLRRANREQLVLSGIPPENIEISKTCNHCSKDYFSYRRDKDSRRFAVGIMLRGEEKN